ncbi:unnamed protein product [Rotaria sp. Silwood1]|nr:unnamed protein product [Rotaria sp. Silwood1]CAF1425514.1 unnamed protein product [Rotaria sp. Silwood1]CAF3637161.1 unnamed protein product [Rotaria sp. Silwood1]
MAMSTSYFVIRNDADLKKKQNFITKQVENKLGVDLNGDGMVGSGRGQSQGYGGAGGGVMNQVEKATNMDLNGDGRVGGGMGHGQQSGGYGHNPNSGGSGGLMNQLEKATHMDLNGDGRVGGSGHY